MFLHDDNFLLFTVNKNMIVNKRVFHEIQSDSFEALFFALQQMS